MKKEEILALCIDEIRSGKLTIEECTARYPEVQQELAALLKIAAEIKSGTETPSPEFKSRAKRALFEQMQDTKTRADHRVWFWPQQTAFRVVAGIATVIIIFGTAGGGTVYAAQSSLPGDILYPVKLSVENIQLAVTLDAADKADLHLTLAQRRIDEATEQAQLNRNIDIEALGTVKQQYDDAIKELNNSNNAEASSEILSRISAATLDQQVELEQVMSNTSPENQKVLRQTIDEMRRGNVIAQVAYANDDFLDNQPSVTDKTLDAGQFKIEGTLIEVQDKTWNIDGTLIENIHYSGEVPAVGSQVKIEGIVKNNETFISRIEITNKPAGTTKIEGKFGGKTEDGTADISGISVIIGDHNDEQLKPGDEVRLQGDTRDGKLAQLPQLKVKEIFRK